MTILSTDNLDSDAIAQIFSQYQNLEDRLIGTRHLRF